MSSLLIEKIRAIEQRHIRRRGGGLAQKPPSIISTGWAEVDAAIGGGLACGGLHEWFGLGPTPRSAKSLAPASAAARTSSLLTDENAPPAADSWRPPVGVPVHLAWRALQADAEMRWTLWIGRRCFPYPAVLLRRAGRDRRLLDRSLFVSPRCPADRLWAIDLALRSPAVGVVIADGGGFNMAATRRIQLAAKNHGTLALLVRPPWERDELSAAQSRWLVRQGAVRGRQGEASGERAGTAWAPRGNGGETVATDHPMWTIELLRCKGVQVGMALGVWRLEWNRAACTLHLSSALGDPAGVAQAATLRAAPDASRRRFA